MCYSYLAFNAALRMLCWNVLECNGIGSYPAGGDNTPSQRRQGATYKAGGIRKMIKNEHSTKSNKRQYNDKNVSWQNRINKKILALQEEDSVKWYIHTVLK